MDTKEVVIAVTELTCAVLDERWRARWLAGKKPSTQLPPPKGAAVVHGQAFHQIVESFNDWLVTSEQAGNAPPAEGETLFAACYDLVAGEKLRELLTLHPHAMESVVGLRDCLNHYCHRLAQLRQEIASGGSWRELLVGIEVTPNPVRFSFGDRSVLVKGRLDAVRRHPQADALEVVDYKLSRGNNFKHDLVQLAIYAELLRHHAPTTRFHGTLEYYLPQLHAQDLSQEALQAIFQEMVEPVLKELGAVAQPAPAPDATGEDLSEQIQQVFAAFRLGVTVTHRMEAPQLTRYCLRPEEGVKTVSLASRAKDLQVHLNLNALPCISHAPGCVILDIPRPAPLSMDWSLWRQDKQLQHSPLAFPIGVGVENRLLTGNLGDVNQCHLLVAGSTGSGKSVFLQALVATLMARNTPRSLRLGIVDPKRLTFTALDRSPYLLRPVAEEAEEAIELLKEALEEMERRYLLLKKERLESLHQWHERGSCPLPFWVLVMDEFADLVLADKAVKQSFEKLVGRIAGKARAAGIHLVLSTQRPDRTVVTGIIKSNLPLKICLRVANGVNSSIILDEGGGENLLGKGDLLCNLGPGLQRAQALYLTSKELARIAKGAG